MKQKTIAILLTIALLAGCNTPAPAAPSAAEPDMEAIIQQSVDEAVKEKLEQIEEEQRKKDEEIAKLKEQLEELTSQQEAPRRKAPPPLLRTPHPRPRHPANRRLPHRLPRLGFPRSRNQNRPHNRCQHPLPSSQRKPSR